MQEGLHCSSLNARGAVLYFTECKRGCTVLYRMQEGPDKKTLHNKSNHLCQMMDVMKFMQQAVQYHLPLMRIC